MAGVITTGNFPKALWPGVKAFWGRSYDQHVKKYVDLFDIETSDKAYEEDVLATGFGLAPVKTEGASTQYDSESQGYVSRYTHIAYSLGYVVTLEEIEDCKYDEVSKRRTQGLAFSMNQTREVICANVYNRAFTAAYTGGDGKEMIATDHSTLSGNQANEPTAAADFSEASLEDMVIQTMDAKNDRGLRIALMPETLIVPTALAFEATRVLKSTLQNDTANNAINAVRSMNVIPGGVKVNPYLSDSDAWFLRTNAPRGLLMYDRSGGVRFTQDGDFDTDNVKYKAYMRFIPKWTDFRGVYGSPGA